MSLSTQADHMELEYSHFFTFLMWSYGVMEFINLLHILECVSGEEGSVWFTAYTLHLLSKNCVSGVPMVLSTAICT